MGGQGILKAETSTPARSSGTTATAYQPAPSASPPPTA